MIREEALAELVRRGSKSEPNLYFKMMGGTKGRPKFPQIETIIEFGDRKPLDDMRLALGGRVCTGYDSISVTPTLLFLREEAFNLLYPYDQLIWPLERTGTHYGKMKAWYGREMLRTCLAQNKIYD